MQFMKKQVLRFVVVGILSTFINYTVFYVLYKFIGFGYLLSSASGFLAGVVFGYRLNRTWTFELYSDASLFHKYLLVYCCSLLLTLIFMEILISRIGIPAEIANVVCIILTTCTNFFGMKMVVFTSRKHAGKSND